VYESIRQGGKWDDLHRGLLKFSLRNEKSRRPFPVSVTTVVSKANFHEIALIPHVFSYLARPIDFAFAFLNSKPPFHPSDDPRDDYFQQQSYFGEPYTRSLPCRLMWTRVSLLKEGGLTPCCTDYDGRMVCDSIGTADLSRWFQNPLLESWRKASLEGNFSLLPADCQSCYSVDPRLTELLNMIMKYTLVRLSLHPVRAQVVLNTVGPMIQERDFDGIMEVMRSLDSVV
jgi:hypothetical protein